MVKSKIILSVIVLTGLTGCAKRPYIHFEEAEPSNFLEIILQNGEKIQGTVMKSEPHQLVLLASQNSAISVPKNTIRLIRRKPPVYDQFGRGISEEEIQSVKTSKNTVIYTLGGGVLSFGSSFFLGSMLGKESGNVLAATTLGFGTLGTFMFFRAGRAMDRREAIRTVNDIRLSSEHKRDRKPFTAHDSRENNEE
ncbi:MAG TPA: hypothetical protein ENN03_08505 [bacterium]|nr:hypothetical protein [bacterium]